MKQEILDAIKSEYLKQKEQKRKVDDMISRLETLKENEYVIEYINLLNALNNINYKRFSTWTDENILDSVFRMYSYKNDETNGIYVYLGTFILDNLCDMEHGPCDKKVDRTDPRAEYRIYQDIECIDAIRIPINRCEEFEKTHKIIYPNNRYGRRTCHNIQKEFIRDLITTSQEEACKKLLKKYSNKKL